MSALGVTAGGFVFRNVMKLVNMRDLKSLASACRFDSFHCDNDGFNDSYPCIQECKNANKSFSVIKSQDRI